VRDKDRTVALVQSALGFIEPKPRWSHGAPGQGFRVTFCRANPSLAHSPTLIELIEPAALDPQLPLTEVVPNVQGFADRQGTRPLQTHGAPVASSHVDDLIERVRGLGLRHWVQPATDRFPFSRLWMGITASDLAGHRPDDDGGLMLEVVDTVTLGLPAGALDGPLPPAEPAPGGFTRTLARCFLVDDLDRRLEAVARTFGWEPELVERGEGGARRATLGFTLPQSARIELIQPAGGREEHEFLTRHGAGIWCVRVGVRDLDEKAEDLARRGTAVHRVDTGFANPSTVLRVDAGVVPGCRFEFAPG